MSTVVRARARGGPGGRFMRIGEKLVLAVAVLLGLFGFVILTGVLIGLLEGTSEYSLFTNLLLSFLLGCVPLAVGVLLLRRVRNSVARREIEAREAQVLRVAQERQGTVSAVDVATGCGMSLEQAQKTLDQLHLRGFSEMDVEDSGTVVYRFRR
jgi:hypothetical protein